MSPLSIALIKLSSLAGPFPVIVCPSVPLAASIAWINESSGDSALGSCNFPVAGATILSFSLSIISGDKAKTLLLFTFPFIISAIILPSSSVFHLDYNVECIYHNDKFVIVFSVELNLKKVHHFF